MKKIMAMKNLGKASATEFSKFLNSFDVALCDCDGVLWGEREVFDGIRESLSVLSSLGKSIKFVSNNTLHSLNNFHKKICTAHAPTTKHDFVTPLVAMVDHLKKIGIRNKIYIIGSTHIKQEFVDAGFDVVKISQALIEENYAGLMRSISECNDDVGAVISDFDPNMTYSGLLKAGIYLQQPDVVFMCGATENWALINNKKVIGPGYFTNALADLTGRQPIVFGKPDINLNTCVQNRFNITDPSRVLFIGDGLEQDMCFASRCGYQKLMVLTGKTQLSALTSSLDPEQTPDYYISSLGDVHKLITCHKL